MNEAAPRETSTAGGMRGVLVTHGSMSFGLVDAVRRIAGPPGDALVAVSNDGLGPDELLHAVTEVGGDGPLIIFTDLHSGSCTFAARLACSSPGGRRVICGVNLPMLLDFVFHRDLPPDELVGRLVERGRSAIRSFDPGG